MMLTMWSFREQTRLSGAGEGVVRVRRGAVKGEARRSSGPWGG